MYRLQAEFRLKSVHQTPKSRVLGCREVTPEPVGFPGARLTRRVRRKGKKSTETVYLISSLTFEPLTAAGWLRLKRGYWVIESGLHHPVDVSLDEDRSRVRNGNAALVLGMIRRLVESVAQSWLATVRTPRTRWSVRGSSSASLIGTASARGCAPWSLPGPPVS